MPDVVEGKIIAIGVGGGLLIAAGPLLAVAIRNQWLFDLVVALLYLGTAAMVAYRYTSLSWRTGLWFFIWLPPLLLVSTFFGSSAAHMDWSTGLRNLLDYGFGFIGACLGGWCGATLRMRRNRGSTLVG